MEENRKKETWENFTDDLEKAFNELVEKYGFDDSDHYGEKCQGIVRLATSTIVSNIDQCPVCDGKEFSEALYEDIKTNVEFEINKKYFS